MSTRLWIRTLQRMRSKRWYFVRGDCSQSRNRQYQAIPNNTGQFDEECHFFWDGDTALFGDALMSTWQWQRLMKCSCTWVGSTYKVDLKQVFCARWRPADNIRCQICARQSGSVWPIYISTHTVLGNAPGTIQCGQHRLDERQLCLYICVISCDNWSTTKMMEPTFGVMWTCISIPQTQKVLKNIKLRRLMPKLFHIS